LKITIYKCDACGKEASAEEAEKSWVSTTGEVSGISHFCRIECATKHIDLVLARQNERHEKRTREALKKAFEGEFTHGFSDSPFSRTPAVYLFRCGDKEWEK